MGLLGEQSEISAISRDLASAGVATLTFGKTAHLTFMPHLARFMLWVAVAAWVLVAAAFLARLAGQPR